MLYFIARTSWLLWCWLELMILTMILYLLSWLPRKFTALFYHSLSRLWCRYFVRAMGVYLRLHQKNRHPLPKQYILVANHPSAFEDFGIPALFNVIPLAKQGVRKWFIIGRMSIAAGTLFVKRDNRESRRTVVDQLIDTLQQDKKNISIFPEGGCMGRRIHSTFHYGAFDISIRTGIPILPVFLVYEAQETFEWMDPDTLLHKIWHFMTSQNNRSHYYVHDAIDPKNFTSKKEFAEYVHKLYLTWQQKYLE